MNRLLLILIAVISFYTCKVPSKSTTASEIKIDLSKQNFDWIAGTWERIDSNTIYHFEVWKKIKNLEYRGIVYSLIKNKIVQQQKLSLSYRNKKWSYDIVEKKNNLLKKFELYAFGQLVFVAYNYHKEIPVKIIYATNLNKDSLYTSIFLGEEERKFNFKKVK